MDILIIVGLIIFLPAVIAAGRKGKKSRMYSGGFYKH